MAQNSTTLKTLTAPPDAFGALYFLPGQFLFQRLEEGRQSVKALSSASIGQAFREYQADSGWIGRRLLRCRENPDGNYILSFEPAGLKTIIVQSPGGEVSRIRIPLPPLILLGYREDFHLWAVRGREARPNSRLAVAPLPNIGANSSGQICFGKNRVPEASVANLDSIWNLIFDSPFSGDHSSQKSRSHPEDVRWLLFALAEEKKKRFPNSELVEVNATIDDLWRQAIEKKVFSVR